MFCFVISVLRCDWLAAHTDCGAMLSLRCDVFTESLSWNQSPVSYDSDSKRLLQMVCANIQCWLEFYICDVFRVKQSEAISTVVLYSVFVSLHFFYFIGVFRCLSVYECVSVLLACFIFVIHYCHVWCATWSFIVICWQNVNPLKGRDVNWLHWAIQVKPTFLISDIRALWRSALSARVPDCQKLKL